MCNRKCIFKWSIFHCHVSLPEAKASSNPSLPGFCQFQFAFQSSVLTGGICTRVPPLSQECLLGSNDLNVYIYINISDIQKIYKHKESRTIQRVYISALFVCHQPKNGRSLKKTTPCFPKKTCHFWARASCLVFPGTHSSGFHVSIPDACTVQWSTWRMGSQDGRICGDRITPLYKPFI